MTRSASAGVYLIAVTFVVLPLYEFADVGERRPRDGGYAMIVLAILFGIALLVSLRKTASVASQNRFAYQAVLPQLAGGIGVPTQVPVVNALAILRIVLRTLEERHWRPVGSSSFNTPRFLTLSDFRL
jgi:hypothetical protein